MVHALCRAGFPWQGQRSAGLSAEVADRVLGRLAGASLLTFNVAGTTASAHRLVIRVIRERLAARERLAQVCAAAAQVLDGLAWSLHDSWHQDRSAVRDLIEQITALGDSADRCPSDADLGRGVIRLRSWAVVYWNYLGDSTAQAIAVGAAGRRSGAAARPRPPRHPDLAQQPRQRLPGRGTHRRGDHPARADSSRPGTAARPRPPRHSRFAQQPRHRLPGCGTHR